MPSLPTALSQNKALPNWIALDLLTMTGFFPPIKPWVEGTAIPLRADGGVVAAEARDIDIARQTIRKTSRMENRTGATLRLGRLWISRFINESNQRFLAQKAYPLSGGKPCLIGQLRWDYLIRFTWTEIGW